MGANQPQADLTAKTYVVHLSFFYGMAAATGNTAVVSRVRGLGLLSVVRGNLKMVCFLPPLTSPLSAKCLLRRFSSTCLGTFFTIKRVLGSCISPAVTRSHQVSGAKMKGMHLGHPLQRTKMTVPRLRQTGPGAFGGKERREPVGEGV